MSLASDCACDQPIEFVPNDPCAVVNWGDQIVGALIQKMSGSPFNGLALVGTAGGIITNLADWQAKMAATDDDKIVFLPNLASTTVPEATDTEITGNDVPYGGRIITARDRSVTGRIRYPNAGTIEAVNKAQCWGKVRVWLLDNNNYLQGGNTGIEDMDFIIRNLVREGLGGGKYFPFLAAWNSIPEHPISANPLPFLKTLQNVA